MYLLRMFFTCGVCLMMEVVLGQDTHAREELIGRIRNTSRHDTPEPAGPQVPVISIGASLVRIISFDRESAVATALLWERLLWQIDALTWDPADYGNITEIRMRPTDVWFPDILVYGELDADKPRELYSVVVYYTGEVLHVAKIIRKTRCKKDGEIWMCELKYASWTFNGFYISLDSYDGLSLLDLSEYLPQPSYELAEGEWSKGLEVIYYQCCAEPYPSVKIPFYLKPRDPASESSDLYSYEHIMMVKAMLRG